MSEAFRSVDELSTRKKKKRHIVLVSLRAFDTKKPSFYGLSAGQRSPIYPESSKTLRWCASPHALQPMGDYEDSRSISVSTVVENGDAIVPCLAHVQYTRKKKKSTVAMYIGLRNTLLHLPVQFAAMVTHMSEASCWPAMAGIRHRYARQRTHSLGPRLHRGSEAADASGAVTAERAGICANLVECGISRSAAVDGRDRDA